MGRADHQSRLYLFSHFVPDPPSTVLLTHSDDVSRLWHERFGHLNYRYLQQLNQQSMVIGLPSVQFSGGVCQGCILGKHPKEKFDKGKAWRASQILELVHSDLAGPFQHPSFSKARYVLTFIDDFSRYTWVYFLKQKSEVFEHFQDFKTFVEKQSGNIIKVLRTDNGGEYVNHRFEKFCTSEGIDLQHSVPYNPQQNGVAERKNRFLKEMANCMIHSRSLAPQYWAEAINCACYIQNRVPHQALKGITPFEAWSGRKPSVKHFRVFGSPAWAHIPAEKRKALDPQSRPCIFVGYPDGVKGYRLLHPTTHELFIERSVQFEEGSLSSLSITSPPPSTLTLESLGVHDISSDELDSPEKSSSNDESDSEDSPPSSLSHHSEANDSPPHSPSSSPLWARQTLQSAGDWVGDPLDTRRTRSQFQDAPHVFMTTALDPQSFHEASGIPEWDTAMQEEYSSLMRNHTWDLVPLPKGRKLVRCKWIYQTKFAADGSVDKHKACLVAKGFS